MAVGLGSDFHCVDDVDATLSTVDGGLGVAEAYARRLGTQPLGLFYDRDYGAGIGDLIGAATSGFVVQQRAQAEALKEERINDAQAKATFLRAGDPGVGEDDEGRLDLECEITFDDTKTFDFTVNVSTDGTTTLKEEIA